jgi:acyl carrier protein
VGGFDFEPLQDWFALDEGHVYLHGLLGGRIDAKQTRLEALVQDSGELRTLLRLAQEMPEPSLPPVREPGPDGTLVKELQRFLREKLPEYMMPASFVLLEALPLTPNGKVDRKALPMPDVTEPELKKTFVAPQTKFEQAIATVWQDILQVATVGVHDNFFDLGGTSVHIVRVHNKLRETFDKDLPIVKMFEYPTIRSLAKYVDQDQDEYAALQETDERAKVRIAMRQKRRRSRR